MELTQRLIDVQIIMINNGSLEDFVSDNVIAEFDALGTNETKYGLIDDMMK